VKPGDFVTDQHGGRVQIVRHLENDLVEVRTRTSDITRIVPASSLRGSAIRPELSRSRTTTNRTRSNKPVSKEEVMSYTAISRDDLVFEAGQSTEEGKELQVANVDDYTVVVSVEEKGKAFLWKVVRNIEGQDEPETIDDSARFQHINRGLNQAARMAVIAINKDRRTRAKSESKAERETRKAEPETQPDEPQVGDGGPEANERVLAESGNAKAAEAETQPAETPIEVPESATPEEAKPKRRGDKDKEPQAV
jgi:hypothetical protein